VKVNGEKSALKNLIGHQLNRNVGLFSFTKMHCFFRLLDVIKACRLLSHPKLKIKQLNPNSAILPLPKGKKIRRHRSYAESSF
jgi:hypothetical protein